MTLETIISWQLKEVDQETYSQEYYLVNLIFELLDKMKQITVIFRLYFKVIVKYYRDLFRHVW